MIFIEIIYIYIYMYGSITDLLNYNDITINKLHNMLIISTNIPVEGAAEQRVLFWKNCQKYHIITFYVYLNQFYPHF